MAQKEAIEDEIKRTTKLIGDRTNIEKLEEVNRFFFNIIDFAFDCYKTMLYNSLVYNFIMNFMSLKFYDCKSNGALNRFQ